jgi:hypothetical protein
MARNHPRPPATSGDAPSSCIAVCTAPASAAPEPGSRVSSVCRYRRIGKKQPHLSSGLFGAARDEAVRPYCCQVPKYAARSRDESNQSHEALFCSRSIPFMALSRRCWAAQEDFSWGAARCQNSCLALASRRQASARSLAHPGNAISRSCSGSPL